jgi:Plasmid stabilization system protein
MTKLFIAPAARDDLQNITHYIETQLMNPAAAQITITNILKTFHILEIFPLIGTPLSRIANIVTNYRFIKSGNYLIFYKYQTNILYISRILYHKQNCLQILFPNTSLH